MKHSNKAGFTIIETVLFLGVTGLLVMSILVGTGTSINIQRYRDSVNSLQAVFKQQYSEVNNVANSRGADWDCSSANGLALEAVGHIGDAKNRGQSGNCVIMGRLVTNVGTDGKKILIRSVTTSLADVGTTKSDIELLAKSNPIPGGEDYDIDWGSTLVNDAGNPINFSVLIIRSPLNGAVRTFINSDKAVNDEVGKINEVFSVGEPLNTPIKICVNSHGLFNGSKMAVLINANTTSASGVEVLGDASSGCR